MNKADNPKRLAILDAARRVFLAHGYSGASMEAIAEAAPVSKPTLYSHFHGKHDLFTAVIVRQCETLLSTLSQAKTAMPNPAAGLKAIATAFVDVLYAEDALNLYRLLIAEQQHFPGLGEQVYRASAEPALARLSAYLTELEGLSLALGAFVAGMLLSETEYRFQVEDDIRPFRDILLGFFFITVGMKLDIGALFEGWQLVLMLLAILLLLKGLIVFALARYMRHNVADSLKASMYLAQGGEFGFVILAVSHGLNLLSGELEQAATAAMKCFKSPSIFTCFTGKYGE